MDTVNGIKLAEAGAPSLILRDLSECATLAYIASFDAKLCVPKLTELFLGFKDRDKIFVDGTLEAVLSAYAVPIKLKYECPPPSKFGKCRAIYPDDLGSGQRAITGPAAVEDCDNVLLVIREIGRRLVPLVLVWFFIAGVHLPVC